MERLDVFPVLLSAFGETRGHIYKAFCPELDLHATGHTPQEAQHELQERVRIFLLAKCQAYEDSLSMPEVPRKMD